MPLDRFPSVGGGGRKAPNGGESDYLTEGCRSPKDGLCWVALVIKGSVHHLSSSDSLPLATEPVAAERTDGLR